MLITRKKCRVDVEGNFNRCCLRGIAAHSQRREETGFCNLLRECGGFPGLFQGSSAGICPFPAELLVTMMNWRLLEWPLAAKSQAYQWLQTVLSTAHGNLYLTQPFILLWLGALVQTHSPVQLKTLEIRVSTWLPIRIMKEPLRFGLNWSAETPSPSFEAPQVILFCLRGGAEFQSLTSLILHKCNQRPSESGTGWVAPQRVPSRPPPGPSFRPEVLETLMNVAITRGCSEKALWLGCTWENQVTIFLVGTRRFPRAVTLENQCLSC